MMFAIPTLNVEVNFSVIKCRPDLALATQIALKNDEITQHLASFTSNTCSAFR